MEQKDISVTSETRSKEDTKPKRTIELRKDSQKSSKSEKELRSSLSSSKEKDEEIQSKESDVVTASPKVPRKFINNWRQACDRTKDKTKELLKKWRTLPEQTQGEQDVSGASISDEGGGSSGWSEHIWTTWVKRFPSGDDSESSKTAIIKLTETQRSKFANFFVYLLDMDRDDVISLSDFDVFTERLRHFADWSKNSTEYHRLREVQMGFVETFLLPRNQLEKVLMKEQISLEEWLRRWSDLLEEAASFQQLPLWLQYFPRILFIVINKSGTGMITRDELGEFYTSILGLTTSEVQAFINDAYRIFTSNGDHQLTYGVYRLCFANFVFAKYPNGPGQYLLGPSPSGAKAISFPVDYKALSCAPQDLEQYSPELKSNRRSVVV